MEYTSQKSALPLFLLLSLGVHVIGYALFTAFSPKIQEPQSRSVQISLQQSSSRSSESKPVSSSLPKIQTKPISKPVPKVVPKAKETPVTAQEIKAVQQKIQPKVQKQVAPLKQTIQKNTPTQQTKSDPKKATQQPVKPQVTEIPKDTLADELEQLLANPKKTSHPIDQLADAAWNGTPRKTLSFPNILSYIPEQYKIKGYGFSVTAKITFDPQGLVSTVEFLNSSGDPRIDSIFRKELRKIRIEQSKKNSYDTIIKTFSVTIQ